MRTAHDMLKEDHREAEAHYDAFMSTSGEERQQHADQLLDALTVHAAIEEELYYPMLEEAGEKELAEEFRAEHTAVKTQIGKLKLMGIDNEEYEPTMKAMMEDVLHHVEEEESEAFPLVEKLIGTEKLEGLATDMTQRKEELKGSTLKRMIASLRP